MYNYYLNQKQFDYVYKYLDFDKLNNNWMNEIFFEDNKTMIWFVETYCINNNKKSTISIWIDDIHYNSQEGYEYLKENFGNGIFILPILYPDKQELKIIVNRIINIRFSKKNIRQYGYVKIINKIKSLFKRKK